MTYVRQRKWLDSEKYWNTRLGGEWRQAANGQRWFVPQWEGKKLLGMGGNGVCILRVFLSSSKGCFGLMRLCFLLGQLCFVQTASIIFLEVTKLTLIFLTACRVMGEN